MAATLARDTLSSFVHEQGVELGDPFRPGEKPGRTGHESAGVVLIGLGAVADFEPGACPAQVNGLVTGDIEAIQASASLFVALADEVLDRFVAV